MSMTPEDVRDEVDDFVDSMLDNHENLPKRLLAGELENKAEQLYNEDEDDVSDLV